MNSAEHLLLIRGFDFFAHISDEEYEELNIIHRFIEAKKGEYIYFQSNCHNKLYFAKEGYIKVGQIDEQGNEVIKEIIQKGEVFGQFTLERNNLEGEFAKAYKYDVSLCAFTIEDFLKVLKLKPEMAISFTAHIGNKLRKIENRLVNLLNKDVKTRLVNMLLQLVPANNTGNSAKIERFFTHEDVARLIGSSRQTVTTLLGELESAELVKITKDLVVIPDLGGMKKLLLSAN